MKRHITFLLIQFVAKPYLWALIALIISFYRYFPESPSQLTIYDNVSKVYTNTCPHLMTQQSIANNHHQLSDTFTLLNWNIYKQQKPQWAEQLKEWAEQADLITLQEAKYSEALINITKQPLYYLQNNAFMYQDQIYGVNTLSRRPAEKFCGTRFSEPWTFIAKTALASTYPLQGIKDSLLVINVHGVNFTLTASPLKEQITPYLQLIEQHQGPIIMAGDFNTWSEARSNAILNAMHAASFHEVQFNPDQRLKAFGLPLDHIFYRGLQVIKAKSITTVASDHTPQLITFRLLAENK